MSNYITGEPMVPPSEREAVVRNGVSGGPINWPLREKCQKMDNAELESLVREATQILSERKNARAQKLIEKVCVALNELKEMGGVEFRFDCSYDAFVHDILDEVDHFRPEMFVIRRK